MLERANGQELEDGKGRLVKVMRSSVFADWHL